MVSTQVQGIPEEVGVPAVHGRGRGPEELGVLAVGGGGQSPTELGILAVDGGGRGPEELGDLLEPPLVTQLVKQPRSLSQHACS